MIEKYFYMMVSFVLEEKFILFVAFVFPCIWFKKF